MHEPRTRADRRRLTHVDRSGRPRMVDVSEKQSTPRRAVAEAEVTVDQETLSLVIDGLNPKGDVLTVAELAGVMGGKRTAELIPLCHPIPLTDLTVEIRPDRAASALIVQARAATVAPTGVEMEALTAVSVAALTIYDMLKAVDRGIEIRTVRLLEKSGGRSGDWRRADDTSDEVHGDGRGSESGSRPARTGVRRPAGRSGTTRPRGFRGPKRTG